MITLDKLSYHFEFMLEIIYISGFFKKSIKIIIIDCMNLKDECNLRFLKNTVVQIISKLNKRSFMIAF